MNTIAKTMAVLSVGFAAGAAALTYPTANFAVVQTAGTGNLYANGEIADYVQVYEAKDYTVTVSAGGTACDGVYPTMQLKADSMTKGSATVSNSSAWQNYAFTVNLAAGVHRIGFAFVNDAMNATGDRNLFLNQFAIGPVGGGAEPVRTTQAAWHAAAQAQESAIVANTAAAIDQHRKSGAVVRVVDANGNPIAGASVSVSQTKHDFLFGANFMSYQGFDTSAKNNTYQQRFAEVFNYATAPLYWNGMEPAQGQYNTAWYDGLINWLVANGIQVKGHPILWIDPSGLPAWTGGNPSTAQMQTRTNWAVSRYLGLVNAWEVVNEPMTYPSLTLAQPHAWVRALDPAAKIVVNEYGQFADGADRFYGFVQAQLAAGVPIDVLGFQAHAPVDMAFPLAQVQEKLAKYAALGKEIHITEFTPVSSGIAVTGANWRGAWTEQTQADYAEDFYRVCFANPAVGAISWWDFTDQGSWLAGGGLLRSDLTAKPAYDALKALIKQEWNTQAAGASSSGQYAFRGFHGTYNVSVTLNGETKTATMNVRKGQTNEVTLSFATVQAPPAADTAAPVIAMAGSNPVTVAVGTAYTDAGASATDNVDGNVTARIQTASTVNMAAVGTYSVTYRVSDNAGNQATASRTVYVVDTVKPVITLVGSASVSIRRNRTYTDAGAMASDNYDGNISSKIVRTGTVNTAKTGTYYLYFNVKDNANNAATQVRRTVKVTY